MIRRQFVRSAAALILALQVGSCVPQLGLEPLSIVVQIQFTEFHSNVTASWTGQMTSTIYTGGSYGSAQTTANQQLSGIGNVVPPQFENFPPATNIHGGTWSVDVSVFENGTSILEITCSNIDVGDISLVNGGTYTVRVIEDSNNCISAAGPLNPPTPPVRDVEAVSMTAPASVNIGDIVNISVEIANNSEIDENIGVELRATPPSGGAGFVIDDTSRIVAVADDDTVDFSWDTSCIATGGGGYLLTATATAPNDSVSNNTQSAVIQLNADRELSLINLTDPTTVSQSQVGGHSFTARLINGDSVAEPGIDLQFTDTSTEAPGVIQWLTPPPINLACGETKDLAFQYLPPSITSGVPHDLNLSIGNVIPGDDPADNSQTVTVTVVP